MSEDAQVEIVFDRAGVLTSRKAIEDFTRQVLLRSLDNLGLPDLRLTVLYCSQAYIRRLNKQFRDIDKPTDVLSFPDLENPRRIRKASDVYIGDLAICLPVCARHAKALKKKPADELALLLVHGLLHLLGRDHDTPAKEKAMWAEQNGLVANLASLKHPRFTVRKTVSPPLRGEGPAVP